MSTDFLADLNDLEETDLSFCDNAASFLQSGFWGAFKARFGWEARAFKTVWRGGEIKPLLVLHRSLASVCRGKCKLLSMAYVPWGPELPSELSAGDEQRWAALKELAGALRQKLHGTAFIRFDPPWFMENSSFPPPPPFSRAGADVQPPDTVLLDLTQSMDSLREQMKPKWRYNARLALKKGVTVRSAGADGVEVFYALLKETARRDGIAIHSIDYYRVLFEESKTQTRSPFPGPHSPLRINLYLAEHEGDVLAGIVTLFRGREAVYLYGSSSDKKRSLMAPYALQFKAMEDAREAGCEVYDLFGIPPNEDPDHPMAGLYRFKTGFGGAIVHRPGSWDYPCRPLLYRLFRGAETMRKNLRIIKKRERKQRPEE